MKQTKRCFKSTMQIKSGVCEGSYETSLCATNQEEVTTLKFCYRALENGSQVRWWYFRSLISH